ncbi:MAG: anaerobic ribonucleoside-triphosphate reductase activating protein [Actinobacteria bacterium]|nr:anaerobic ribonucleoside-triphosphate reductase activating protein [Actinomycetota bacterium]
MAVRTEQDFAIKGYIPLSMLDWEGRLVTTVFLGGCNFHCPFCHNAELVTGAGRLPDVAWGIIEGVLADKAGWIDGVCVSGGEPTLSEGLFELLRRVKSFGFKVKLDTNGSRPNVLKKLLEERLIDAVAMDIKTSFDKYSLVSKTADSADRVRASIDLLVEAEAKGLLDAEFRTTVVPTIVEREDVIEVAQYLRDAGAGRYMLQQFNPKTVMRAEAGSIKPLRKDALEKLAAEISSIVPATAIV